NKLQATERRIKDVKDQANVLFLDESKHSFQTQIAKVQDQLLDAERELQERKAVLGNLALETNAAAGSNSFEVLIPQDKLNDYGEMLTRLEKSKKDKGDLLLQYKEAHPM